MLKNVTISMSDEAFARLEKLKIITQADGLHQVIGDSIRVYEAIIEASELGGQVLIPKDGTIGPMPIFANNG